MIKQPRHEMLAVLLACAVVALWMAPTSAQTKFMEKLRRQYQLGPATGKCELCHELKAKEEPGRKNLNAYGKALQAEPCMKPILGKDDKYKYTEADLKMVLEAASKIENQDSDGDGATNKEELELGTFPGDTKSTPDKAKLEKYRKDHPAAAPDKAPPGK